MPPVPVRQRAETFMGEYHFRVISTNISKPGLIHLVLYGKSAAKEMVSQSFSLILTFRFDEYELAKRMYRIPMK